MKLKSHAPDGCGKPFCLTMAFFLKAETRPAEALLGFLEKPIVIKKLVAYSRKQAKIIDANIKK